MIVERQLNDCWAIVKRISNDFKRLSKNY